MPGQRAPRQRLEKFGRFGIAADGKVRPEFAFAGLAVDRARDLAVDEHDALVALRHARQELLDHEGFGPDLTEHLHRHGLGIIVYTGFTLSELRAMKEPAVERVLAVTDTLIDGPYRAELDDGKAFRGSANQVIHHLTPRYRAYFSVPAERRTTIQKNGGVYSLTGIPTERAKEEWLSLHRKFSKGEMIP